MSLSSVQTELETLRKTIQEVGSGIHFTAMLQALDSVEHSLTDKGAPLPVLVLFSPDDAPAWTACVAGALRIPVHEIRHGNIVNTPEFQWRFQSTAAPLGVVLGRLPAPVALWFAGKPPSAQQCQEMTPLLRHTQMLKVYHSPVAEGDFAISIASSGLAFQSVSELDAQTEGEAVQWLQHLRSGPLGGMLLEQSALSALEQVAQLNRDNIAQENRLVGLRKALQTQSGNAIKLEESSFNASDLGSQVRNRIQTVFSDLEKNIKARWDDLNKPQTGEFFRLSTQYTEALEALEEQENFEKSEKVSLRPAKAFEDELCHQVQSVLLQQFEDDARTIRNSLNNLNKEVNQLLQPQQIAGLEAVSEVQRRFPFQKIIDSYATLTKSYQGEITKRGFTEYFVALREYTSLISTVIGLLMPIVIGIGGFEVLDEFVLKQKEHQTTVSAVPSESAAPALDPSKRPSRWETMSFSQKLRTTVYSLSALISIGMLIYGLYSLSNRIPQMRVEAHHREIRKAREALMAESRRMFNDSGREWVGQVSTFCREQAGVVQGIAEKNLKNYTQQRDKKLTENRNQVQRQAQGVDLLQRKLSAVDRTKDQIVQNIANMRRDVAQGIAQQVKQLSS